MSATTAAPAVARAVSARDMLKNLGVKTTPTKKTADKPAFVVDETLTQLIDEYFEHAEKAKDHKTWADNFRDEIVGRARPMFYEACTREGKALSSIRIGKATMTVTNNYTSISDDNEQLLSDAFGEAYGNYFRSVTEISLKKSSIEDPEVLVHLLDCLGVEFFNQHFEQKSYIKVNEALHIALQTNAELREKARPFIEAGIIKPYSPSLKMS